MQCTSSVARQDARSRAGRGVGQDAGRGAPPSSDAGQGAGMVALLSSGACQLEDAVRGVEVFGVDAMTDSACGEPRNSISGNGNVVPRDPYQHSEVMRLRRDLRLNRCTTWTMDRRTGTQSHAGPRAS